MKGYIYFIVNKVTKDNMIPIVMFFLLDTFLKTILLLVIISYFIFIKEDC